ncbi:MAG: rRNA maturation RNase YbeY [Verrucomicrobia bacterium]|nr:rRNA maturation RNase YbeY [Verrucomicrobiota bacterium]NBU10645.1 rRNA maturation RNase YbeY [Pseudomonadota bacterium]NDA67362.1 rRNA maturation RNase YbeY [Verrucomicrobiota bacterium]NDB76080.1 rRNA maturation RNase YbeY [Verrucomicrobiota bacterium]NDD39215.1 rRNA maturation RNase YbeY [Verrucomicrobiota bacterium]
MLNAVSNLKRTEIRAPILALTLRNRQRDRRLNLPFLRRVLRHVLSKPLCVPAAELCFHFVSAEEMARVNWQFLRHQGPTDVITFDYRQSADGVSSPASGALCGEAFVCVAEAVRQAREFQTNWPSEVVRYAVHALLHLSGYDDLVAAKRRVMKREENRLMRELALVFDFNQLETRKSKS